MLGGYRDRSDSIFYISNCFKIKFNQKGIENSQKQFSKYSEIAIKQLEKSGEGYPTWENNFSIAEYHDKVQEYGEKLANLTLKLMKTKSKEKAIN